MLITVIQGMPIVALVFSFKNHGVVFDDIFLQLAPVALFYAVHLSWMCLIDLIREGKLVRVLGVVGATFSETANLTPCIEIEQFPLCYVVEHFVCFPTKDKVVSKNLNLLLKKNRLHVCVLTAIFILILKLNLIANNLWLKHWCLFYCSFDCLSTQGQLSTVDFLLILI